MNEQELLETDFEDLSFSELAIIFAMSKTPTHRTRLQKITLLFDEVYGVGSKPHNHDAYFFGGYSDDIDESATSLTSTGILDETNRGYELTSYGQKLKDYAAEQIMINGNSEEREIVDGMPKIVEALINVPDKYVVGLTYHYYKETATRSTIKDSVERLNRSAKYNGRKLDEIPKQEFESDLREGKKIHLDG